MTPLDLTGVKSSYQQNNWGSFFYGIVRALRPRQVVELGTYHGYSAVHMAAAMRDNGIRLSGINAIDLWQDYPFNRCSIDIPRTLFSRNRLDGHTEPSVFFLEEDALFASTLFRLGCIDLLHIDLSNDGSVLASMVSDWEPKLADDGVILIEGGSVERDDVEWMHKYGKRPIREWLMSPWVNKHFNWVTLDPFPSLTIMRRR